MKNEKENLTGFILAGGKSSRMGQDKGLLLLSGKAMICHAIETLIPFVNEVIVVSNNPEYKKIGYETISDLIKDTGPVAGIYTALQHSTTQKNFIMSCDVPFVSPEIVDNLIKHSGNNLITVAGSAHGVQPLCGVYSKECISSFYECLKNGMVKLKDVIKLVSYQMIDMSICEVQHSHLFKNINTKEDLLLANKIIQL